MRKARRRPPRLAPTALPTVIGDGSFEWSAHNVDVKIGVDETAALVKAEVGDEGEMLKERLEALLSDFWTSAGANGTPPSMVKLSAQQFLSTPQQKSRSGSKRPVTQG